LTSPITGGAKRQQQGAAPKLRQGAAAKFTEQETFGGKVPLPGLLRKKRSFDGQVFSVGSPHDFRKETHE